MCMNFEVNHEGHIIYFMLTEVNDLEKFIEDTKIMSSTNTAQAPRYKKSHKKILLDLDFQGQLQFKGHIIQAVFFRIL